MTIYGYIRFSTSNQNEDRQQMAMNAYRVPEENRFTDKLSGKDLLGTFVADLVLQVLSFGAHMERDNIRKRQKEGIEAARLRSMHLGRPHKQLPDNFNDLVLQWK